MTKAYIFDAFGTLFDLTVPAQRIDKFTRGKSTDLVNLWRTKQLEYTWLRSLMQDYQPFDVVTRNALQYAMNKLSLSDSKLFDILMAIYESPTCVTHAEKSLRRLRSKNMKTGILSNGTPKMLETGIENTGIRPLIDEVISVDAIKTYKPSPKVYQLALDRFGLEKNEVVFVSGNQWDIAGASRFGLPTLWINRNNDTFEQLGHPPDAFINSLKDLV